MKKIIFALGFVVSISACNQSAPQNVKNITDTVSTDKKAIEYTCPMDPEIVKNKPGTCPKCGMDLVEKQSK